MGGQNIARLGERTVARGTHSRDGFYVREALPYAERELLDNAEQYRKALLGVIQSAEKLFADYPDMPLEEYDNDRKIKVAWGQLYDVEQMMEHAIVHVLRHRRQIERWLLQESTAGHQK